MQSTVQQSHAGRKDHFWIFYLFWNVVNRSSVAWKLPGKGNESFYVWNCWLAEFPGVVIGVFSLLHISSVCLCAGIQPQPCCPETHLGAPSSNVASYSSDWARLLPIVGLEIPSCSHRVDIVRHHKAVGYPDGIDRVHCSSRLGPTRNWSISLNVF